MKKFLLGLVVVILVLVGLIFYQRHRVASYLNDLLKGETYGSYGIKVQIPPTEGSVKGFFKPYVNVPRVVIDLSAWGLKMPLNIENAVACKDLWGKASIYLQVPREVTPKEGTKIETIFFELGLDKSLKIMGAKKITFQDKKGEPDVLSLIRPELQFGKQVGLIPDLMVIKVKKIEAKGGDKEGKEGGADLGAMEFGVRSLLEGDKRMWDIYSLGEGGDFQSPEAKGNIGGWKYSFKGSSKEVPAKELLALIKEVGQVMHEEKGGMTEKDPAETQKVIGERIKKVGFVLSKKVLELINRLQIEPKTFEMQWEGLKILDAKGAKEIALLSPLKLQGELQMKGTQMVASGGGGMSKITINPKDGEPIEIGGISFSHMGKYTDTNFSDLMSFLFRYYQIVLQMSVPGLQEKDIQKVILSYLANYPNEMEADIKVDKIDFSTENVIGRHRKAMFTFLMKPEEAGYKFEDNFDYQFKKRPTENINGGNAKFSFMVKLPWGKLIDFARQSVKNPEASTNFFSLLEKKDTGLELKTFLDMGANFFIVDLTSEIMIPIGKALEVTGPFPGMEDPLVADQWFEKLGKSTVQQFVKGGLFLFDVKVERLSKFQAALDRMKEGASLALAGVAPYTVVDSQADTLSSKIEFKEGKILVNGQPSESLQDLLNPFFEKFEAPLVAPTAPASPAP